ncbi:MAG: methyl-accepting chemotaxis protein [Ignavibacteriaceae bacterium]
MNFFKTRGIKEKFQFILAICFFLVGVFLFFYFPLKHKAELTISLQEKAKVVAQMIGKSSSAGLVYDDNSWTTTMFEACKEMHDVEFVMVLKKDGTKFSTFNEDKYGKYASAASELDKNNINIFSDDNIEMVVYPVLHFTDRVGTVIIGLDKADINSSVSSSRITAFIISLVIFLLGLSGVRIFFTKIIYKPIINLTKIAQKLSTGDVNIKISSNRKDEIGLLEDSFISIVDSIKDQSSVAEMISSGELKITAKVKSENDILSLSMNKVVESLNSLTGEVGLLTKSAAEGKLSVRGDIRKYRGGYKEIIKGINDTLDSVEAPINEGVAALGKMAEGNLTVRIISDYFGDHQLIKNSINTVAESLCKTLTDVNESISATANASHEISSSSEQMAAGAQEQSVQTSDVASAVEQMTKTILDTTKNSTLAAEAAKQAGAIAKEGGSVVIEAINGMNRIAAVVRKSADTVHALGKSSNQIGEIAQVIDDIADQTNLLALNAAIEAARAGEQGRGFAVVADEVRKLAERTTKATKEIALMIKQIQKDTTGAVKSMEEGTKEVEKGIELTDKAGQSLNQIIKGAEQVVDIITRVAAASEEQSITSEQISRSIESISNVTHENSGGIKEIANASENLNSLTLNLQKLISKFKIGGLTGSILKNNNDKHDLNSELTTGPDFVVVEA